MSSTLLELTRSAHEEVERLERLIVKDLQTEPPSSRDQLFQSHRVRNMIDTITATTEKLVRFFLSKILALYIYIFICVYMSNWKRTVKKKVKKKLNLIIILLS